MAVHVLKKSCPVLLSFNFLLFFIRWGGFWVVLLYSKSCDLIDCEWQIFSPSFLSFHSLSRQSKIESSNQLVISSNDPQQIIFHCIQNLNKTFKGHNQSHIVVSEVGCRMVLLSSKWQELIDFEWKIISPSFLSFHSVSRLDKIKSWKSTCHFQ